MSSVRLYNCEGNESYIIYDYTTSPADYNICGDPIEAQYFCKAKRIQLIGERADDERRRVVEHESLSKVSTDQVL